MEQLKLACTAFLQILPECRCTPEQLCRIAQYFSLSPGQITRAAQALPCHYDLQYQGVRTLLACCIDELSDIFDPCLQQPLCEVSVPSPLCAVLALQTAADRGLRFTTSALLAQIVLRSIFLDRTPLDPSSCSKRRCGLNVMRRRLLQTPPGTEFTHLLEFGVLCDECTKCCESLDPRIKRLSLTLPKPSRHHTDEYIAYVQKAADRYFSAAADALGLSLEKKTLSNAFFRFLRLTGSVQNICRLNERSRFLPLKGNTLALVQTTQLMVFSDWDSIFSALDTLAAELENAPADDGGLRLYTFYIPFLQPSIDARFLENGIHLTGGGAFLFDSPLPGTTPGTMVRSWLQGMNIRRDTPTECARLAEEISRCGCSGYLTGMFEFDRWMGAAVPMQRSILEHQYGIRTFLLSTDFWCENAMFSDMTGRIDGICTALGR